MTAPTAIDAARQHLTEVRVVTYDPDLHLADEVVVRTDSAIISLPDPVGLWEALTDALRKDHAEHLREYLGGAS